MNYRHTATITLVLAWTTLAQAQLPANVTRPTAGAYGNIAEKFTDYHVVLTPDKDAPEYWAGAPSVARGTDGTFWLAARMRTAESPRGLRGYELRILRSDDGIAFEHAHTIHRDDVPIPGFERPALLRDPRTGKFKLYACGPWQDGPWQIIKFDDVDSPDEFDPKTARSVIGPPEKQYERDVSVIEYKDPVVFYANDRFHCYVTGYVRRNERMFHFASDDGETWRAVGNPYTSLLPLAGWHDFFIRPAGVVPLGIGWLVPYEGSSTAWYDPIYNIATGLAFTFDLHTLIDLTPDAPLLTSQTPSEEFATFRYSTWLDLGDTLLIYAEVAKPNNAFELRVHTIPK